MSQLPDFEDIVNDKDIGNVDPDEMDMEYYQPQEFEDGDVVEEEQENEELKRLQDINDNDNGSLNEDDQSDIESTKGAEFDLNNNNDDFIADEKEAINIIRLWSWDMTLEARWKSASKFLKCVSNIVNKLRVGADEYVVAARIDKNQAGY